MPAAVLADSQYRRGTARVSKTADNEHATATLGDSEPARIQNSPRDTVPEVVHVHEDPSEVESSIAAK